MLRGILSSSTSSGSLEGQAVRPLQDEVPIMLGPTATQDFLVDSKLGAAGYRRAWRLEARCVETTLHVKVMRVWVCFSNLGSRQVIRITVIMVVRCFMA